MMDTKNKWVNSADMKNWYYETFPRVPITKPMFSMRDIFENFDCIPGSYFRFRTMMVVEDKEDE